MNKSMSKKVICFVVIGTMLTPTVAFAKDNISKDETVYVTMYEDGKVKSQIVSDWLHSDTSISEIKDKSILNNIKNIKGKEAPQKNGDALVWKTDKKDLFYQGDTTEQLPLNFKITYYLNDSEIRPTALAGKSGKIKIKIEIENKEKHSASINGKTRTIYTPITVATIVNLPNDTFTNIETNGGPIISVGNNKVVSFVSFPGLTESLGLEKNQLGIDIPNNLEITADADKFKMGPILITATPQLPDMKEIKAADSLEALRKGLNDLKNATNTIQSGAVKLSDGLSMAQKGVNGVTTELSKNNDKLSLVTNKDNVTAERKLIADSFMAMNMDTSLLDMINSNTLNMTGKLLGDYKSSGINALMQSPAYKGIKNTLKDPKTIANTQKMMNDLNPAIAALSDKKAVDSLNALLSPLTPLLKQDNKTTITMVNAIANDVEGLNTALAGLNNETLKNLVNPINTTLLDKNKTAKMLGTLNTLKAIQPEITPSLKAQVDGASDYINSTENVDFDALTNQIMSSNIDLENKKSLCKMIGLAKITRANMVSTLPEAKKMQAIAGGIDAELSKQDVKNLLDNITEENIDNLRPLLQYGNKIPYAQAMLKQTTPLVKAMQSVVTEPNLTNVKPFIALLPQLQTIQNDIAENQKTIVMLNSMLSQLDANKTAALVSKLDTLEADLAMAEPVLIQMNNPSIFSKLQNSPQMVAQLKTMQNDLTTNKKILEIVQDSLSENNIDRANQLIAALPTLTKGVNDLAVGSKTLADGIKEFNTNGIMKLDSTATPKLEEVKDLLAVKDELVKLSENYESFTGIGEEMKGTVKFVMRTDEIKVVEAKQNKKVTVKAEKKSFWQWIKSLF